MYFIEPIPVINANVSSNILAADYAVYQPLTVYNAGDKVTLDDKNYECVINGTVGVSPGTDNIKWLDLGATERFSIFDNTNNTFASNNGLLTYDIVYPNLYSYIAFLGLKANTATITVTDPSVVYSKVIDLTIEGDFAGHSYYFDSVSQAGQLILTDLPIDTGVTLSFTLDNGAQDAELSTFIMGAKQDIGSLQYGVQVGIKDYSRRVTDDFGNVSITKRGFIDTVNYPVKLSSLDLNRVKQRLASVRAKPVLCVGTPKQMETVVLGYIKKFIFSLKSSLDSTCNITVEGLV